MSTVRETSAVVGRLPGSDRPAVCRADSRLLTGEAHDERRRLLRRLDLPALGVPGVPSFDGLDAAVRFRDCEGLGVEGLVLKRGTSLYWPGQRSPDWRKVKWAAWREHLERCVPTRP